jgi:hypothetical protein
MTLPPVAVSIPGGSWEAQGVRRCDAAVRPLGPWDALFAFEDATAMKPVEFATALLARCVITVGGDPVTGVDTVRRLTMGDREALLLHLRRVSYGDRMELVMTCPHCRQRLDISVRASDLLLPIYETAAPDYERWVGAGPDARLIRFRLPRGGDLELAASAGAGSAVSLLIETCVDSRNQAAEEGLAEALDEAIGQLDPQAELRFNLICPVCSVSIEGELNMASHLRRELTARASDLLWDVHTLASTYHWSESDILGMSDIRRLRYLDMADIAASGT